MLRSSEAKNSEGVKRKHKDSELGTRGAYIPPAKLRLMQSDLTDKNSVAFQRIGWELLRKSILGCLNKLNVSNIRQIIYGLINAVNLQRGRGLLCRSVIRAQAAAPAYTRTYAALIAAINSKFPHIGKLLLTRLALQFRRGLQFDDQSACLRSSAFIAHLFNQQVVDESLVLEMLTLLLENPTNNTVQVAVNFLKECGQKLGEVSPRGLTAAFDRLRHVLHEADLDKAAKYAIEALFQVRKDGFKDHPVLLPELDLIDEVEQFTHVLRIQENELNPENELDVFQHDPQYVDNEKKYEARKNEILGLADEETGSSDEELEEENNGVITDATEANLIALRRTIYLTLQSSLDHNECAHKIMKMQLKPCQEDELCRMILDSCAQQRTYEKFFGLLAQRICQVNRIYVRLFEKLFGETYECTHRLDTNKLRNAAKMFAHLLATDAISWSILSHIRLTEQNTTSSSRVFLKNLFQELTEHMGLPKLNARFSDPTQQTSFEGIFPRDDPRNTRFAINFYIAIGLGDLQARVELIKFLQAKF